MQEILLVLSPILVMLITQGVKQAQSIELAPNRVALIRFLVAVMALGSAVGTALLTGGDLDEGVVRIFVDTTFVFAGATFIHYLKKRGEEV